MSSDESEAKSAHIRSVTITGLAAGAGVVAAVLSGVVTAEIPADQAATDIAALGLLLVAIVIQIPFIRVIGYDDFGGAKDILFVGFMTFAIWFVTFGIILTTGVEFI